MTAAASSSMLQMRSTLRSDATLEISLAEVETPKPGEDEVLVRVEAAPINPSDLGLLFAGKEGDQAVDGGRDVARVDAGEHEMTGFGRLQGRRLLTFLNFKIYKQHLRKKQLLKKILTLAASFNFLRYFSCSVKGIA